MNEIEKLKFSMNSLKDQETSAIINNLIEKINELTKALNGLNYEVETIHKWKLQMGGESQNW